jgi:antitoxin (DNA-binding transcriptional repressor) of toxin-antitoxin stability system
VKSISQREFRNASAAIMDAVEQGEVFRVTRHGVVVAELRPVVASGFVARGTLNAAFDGLQTIDLAALRAEADAVFGEDRVGDLAPQVWPDRHIGGH